MRRIALACAAVVALSTLGIVGSASAATPVSSSRVHVSSRAASPSIVNGHIAIGSTWTFYDQSLYPVYACEVLTFSAGGVFSGDLGDIGTWKTPTAKSVLVTFKNGAFFNPASFKGTYGSARGNYTGVLTEAAKPHYGFGPEQLAPGSDPLGVGFC